MNLKTKILICGGGIASSEFGSTLRDRGITIVDSIPEKDYNVSQISVDSFNNVFDIDYTKTLSRKILIPTKKKRKSRQHHGKR